MMLLVSNFVNGIPLNRRGWGAGEFEIERDTKDFNRRGWGAGEFEIERDTQDPKRRGWGAGEFEIERDTKDFKPRVWPGQFENERDMEISKRGVTDYIVKLSW